MINLPLTDNRGETIPVEVILDLQRDLLAMNQGNAKQLVAAAKNIARRADSWIDLSNALTDPNGGLIARYFPDAAERQSFLSSPEYEQLNQLLQRAIKRRGLYPRPSGGKKASAP